MPIGAILGAVGAIGGLIGGKAATVGKVATAGSLALGAADAVRGARRGGGDASQQDYAQVDSAAYEPERRMRLRPATKTPRLLLQEAFPLAGRLRSQAMNEEPFQAELGAFANKRLADINAMREQARMFERYANENIALATGIFQRNQRS